MRRSRAILLLPTAMPTAYCHLETNPGNARALVQRHAEKDVWFNPLAIPLTNRRNGLVFGYPYPVFRMPAYGDAKIPAYEMIRSLVNIMRGCFGGCTFSVRLPSIEDGLFRTVRMK